MTETRFLVTLGANIRELRLKNNMTQSELAYRCKFEKASMSRIESGKMNITVLTLKKISHVLKVDADKFLKIS
jgi:transcriptional regulator with XRE-family HTH domain